MTTTRAQVVAALRDVLPATHRVIDQPREIDEPPADITCVLVVERTLVEPAPNVQGSYREEHHVWVVEPSLDDDVLEDQLDASLDAVLEALAGADFALFRSARRALFQEQYHAYDVLLEVASSTDTIPTQEKP